MVDKITVHLDAIVIRGKMYPFRLNIHHAVTLLEEQNVRRDFRSRSALEGGVGQADRAQQFRPLCDVLAGVGGALIHGEAGGDKGDDAAGTNLVQRLGDEVFVDGQVQSVIAPVSHFELTKRNITHGDIKEVVREIHLFKAANGNAVALVEVTGNPSGNIVQFHAVQFALCHAVRHKAQEVACAAGRLQNVALSETHLGNGLIHGADHGRRRVEGGQGGLSGCCVLRIGKQAFQLCIPTVVRVKAVCQTAPADIPSKDLLLLFRGRPRMVRIIQLLQSLDSSNVVGVAFAGCSCAECIICDAVVGSAFKQRRGGVQPFFLFRQWWCQRWRGHRLRLLLLWNLFRCGTVSMECSFRFIQSIKAACGGCGLSGFLVITVLIEELTVWCLRNGDMLIIALVFCNSFLTGCWHRLRFRHRLYRRNITQSDAGMTAIEQGVTALQIG